MVRHRGLGRAQTGRRGIAPLLQAARGRDGFYRYFYCRGFDRFYLGRDLRLIRATCEIDRPMVSTGRALLDAEKILADAGLKSGMRFADFGCGELGHFAFAAARLVGETGIVYAVDVRKDALATLESRARQANVRNLTAVWGNMEIAGGVR